MKILLLIMIVVFFILYIKENKMSRIKKSLKVGDEFDIITYDHREPDKVIEVIHIIVTEIDDETIIYKKILESGSKFYCQESIDYFIKQYFKKFRK